MWVPKVVWCDSDIFAIFKGWFSIGVNIRFNAWETNELCKKIIITSCNQTFGLALLHHLFLGLYEEEKGIQKNINDLDLLLQSLTKRVAATGPM